MLNPSIKIVNQCLISLFLNHLLVDNLLATDIWDDPRAAFSAPIVRSTDHYALQLGSVAVILVGVSFCSAILMTVCG